MKIDLGGVRDFRNFSGKNSQEWTSSNVEVARRKVCTHTRPYVHREAIQAELQSRQGPAKSLFLPRELAEREKEEDSSSDN